MIEPRRVSTAAFLISALILCLCGCGSGSSTAGGGGGGSPTQPVAGVSFRGVVMAGTSVVSGASVQLYAASVSGYGASASSLLNPAVTTDSTGSFSISGSAYTCASSATQLYLLATGGNSNTAIALLTPVGSCGSVASTDVFSVNEVTTAGFAWALAPFMTSPTAVGTSSTNVMGLENAFASAAVLADVFTGKSPASYRNASLLVESAKVYSLANALDSCTAQNSACDALFSATSEGSAVPTNTAAAALAVVQHPAANVTAIYQLAASSPPYAGLGVAPSDWTMSIETTGSGLDYPTGVALDSGGRAWVANYTGGLTAYTAQGVPVFSAPLTGSALSSIYAVAVDNNDDVWAGNNGTSSLTEISKAGVVLSGSTGYTSKISAPYALESDPNGNIWVANYGNSSLVEVSSSGAALVGPLQGETDFPSALALDGAATPWIAGQEGTVTHYSASGTVLAHASCCHYATAMAIDAAGNPWVSDFFGPGVDILAAGTGALASSTNNSGGLSSPNSIALDGAGNAWVPNYHGGSFSEVAGTRSSAPGTALSPADGFGHDKSLQSPFDVAVDSSGTLWLTSEYDSRLVRFIGVAVPARTPITGPVAKP